MLPGRDLLCITLELVYSVFLCYVFFRKLLMTCMVSGNCVMWFLSSLVCGRTHLPLYLMRASLSVAAALLWTAPELMRIPRSDRPSEGTVTGDAFSFGIILHEICYLTRPYGDQLAKLGAPGISASTCHCRENTLSQKKPNPYD